MWPGVAPIPRPSGSRAGRRCRTGTARPALLACAGCGSRSGRCIGPKRFLYGQRKVALHVGMGGDAREDARQAVDTLLVFLGVDLGHGQVGCIRVGAYSSFNSGHLMFFCDDRSRRINPPCDAICSRVKSVKIGATCCIRSPNMSSTLCFVWRSTETLAGLQGSSGSSCICWSFLAVAGDRLKVCWQSERAHSITIHGFSERHLGGSGDSNRRIARSASALYFSCLVPLQAIRNAKFNGHVWRRFGNRVVYPFGLRLHLIDEFLNALSVEVFLYRLCRQS